MISRHQGGGGEAPSSTTTTPLLLLLLRRITFQQAAISLLLVFLIARQHSTLSPIAATLSLGGGAAVSSPAASRLAEPGTAYEGVPWHNERTVAVETLGETKFARCDVHTVMSEDGSGRVIDDWIFLEELPAVNVVVKTLEGRFVVFRQRKYAIPGHTLSPVGGMVDPNGESPLAAAKREVLEELGLGSRRTLRTIREASRGHDNGRGDPNPNRTLDVKAVADIIRKAANPPVLDGDGLPDGRSRSVPTLEHDPDWVFLGRYRTAANRGGGFLYTYLLKNAVPLVPGGGTVNYNGNTGDFEAQEILFLDDDEVLGALSEARFGEVKWAATFSLAMLHLDGRVSACCGKNNDEVLLSKLG